jgi:hypothetical protein
VNEGGNFQRAYSGRLYSLLSWEQLTAFWQRIDTHAGWHLYAVGELPPSAPADADMVSRFIRDIDALLHHDHRESYCGIVYADALELPSLVKIYDPNNLGSSCGSSKHPPLPGWVMSLAPPLELNPRRPLPEGRRRWWQALQSS